MQQNILVTVFKVESEAYQAMTELKADFKGDNWLVSEAALVKKENGTCTVADVFDSTVHSSDDTLIGGLVGMCIGVLAGPVGLLLGGSYGALVGATVDAVDSVGVASMLEQIGGKIDDGMIALVALVAEETPDALDQKFSKFETVIARFDAAVVAQEVERAQEMENELQRQAKLELRKQKSDEFKAKVEEKRVKIKEALAKEL